MVDIDTIQFGFVPGSGTTDAIFTVLQLQEKYRAVKKPPILPLWLLKKLLTGFPERYSGEILESL